MNQSFTPQSHTIYDLTYLYETAFDLTRQSSLMYGSSLHSRYDAGAAKR